MSAVAATVLAPASLYMTSPTAARPSSVVTVVGSARPRLTEPTSASVMPLLAGPIGVFAMSPIDWNSVRARSENRNCPRRIVPPAAAALADRTALATSSGVRPSARIRSGSISTLISSLGSPTTATLAMPGSCSSRRACTSLAIRAMLRRSPELVRPSTAIGRSPGSLVSRVGRSACSGRAPRALSSRSRTCSTVLAILVPQENLSVVVTSPFRATDFKSTRPGVAATASSIGSATNRDISSAAAPG